MTHNKDYNNGIGDLFKNIDPEMIQSGISTVNTWIASSKEKRDLEAEKLELERQIKEEAERKRLQERNTTILIASGIGLVAIIGLIVIIKKTGKNGK